MVNIQVGHVTRMAASGMDAATALIATEDLMTINRGLGIGGECNGSFNLTQKDAVDIEVDPFHGTDNIDQTL